MKTGLEITALCIDHSKADTPRVQQKIFIPFDFMLDNVVSQFTDSNFEPVDYRITDYKQSIIGLIDEMQKDKDKRYSHQEEDEKQVFWYALQELKQKIEEL